MELTPVEEMGFSPDELRLLSEAGIEVVLTPRENGPWRPTTLEDVDWVGWTVECKRREAKRIRENAEKRARELECAADAFEDRYAEDCAAVIREALPKRKDGTYQKKSLTLDRVTVQLRKKAGGYVVADKDAVLDHVMGLRECDVPATLANSLHFVETHTGFDALWKFRDGVLGKADVLLTPLKEYCASLPPVPNDAGEAIPATIPGVKWEPETETFSFKVEQD